jgi:hypothetical protein
MTGVTIFRHHRQNLARIIRQDAKLQSEKDGNHYQA